MQEKLYWLGFSLFPGVGAKKFSFLLEQFQSAKNAWEADAHSLQEVLGEALTQKLLAFRTRISLEKEVERLINKKISFITLRDSTYPTLLKKISLPPFLLYAKGNISLLHHPKPIAVVGTRKITSYGQEVTQMITRDLVAADCVIVSGLAFGVDAVAHATTLEHKGQTIAVLGSGVDYCTPASNQPLYNAILQHDGLIVSAVPPGTKPNKGSFPARNALIAGLSLGTIVTQGSADSGALITANYAKKFERPVFAVPGPITSAVSQGIHLLLKNGAVPIASAQEILDTLVILDTPKKKGTKSFAGVSSEEKEILNVLANDSLHFDAIVRTIGKDSKTIGSLLSVLELKGIVSNRGGVYSVNI